MTGVTATETVRIERTARGLFDAESTASIHPLLTSEWPNLDVETSYLIQDQILKLRLELGETVVGVKLGLTSRAKQEQMGLELPITGWLTDAMRVSAGARLPFERLIHPRVEPELAFVMGERLAGPDVTPAMALAAVADVYACLEVLDSRYEEFRFRMPDVVADNASASRFALGGVARAPDSLDLGKETCVLEVDGTRYSGRGAAILGDPAEALALAADALARRGRAIEAGWVVLTGGLTDAVPMSETTLVHASYSHLGTLKFRGATFELRTEGGSSGG